MAQMPVTPPLAEIDFERLGPPRGSRLLVVGGCGGIGRAVVAAALKSGVRVAVFDLQRSIDKNPPPAGVALTVAVDATSEAEVAKGFAALNKAWNGLEYLVNLAGFTLDITPFEKLTPAQYDSVVNGSLRSTFLIANAALPRIKASGGGAIVHSASGLAVRVLPGFSPYSAAKAGVIAMTKAIAIENAPLVRANTIAPGVVDTAFHVGGTGRDNFKGGNEPMIDIEAYAKMVPMRRIAVPDDIVGPILFLLGPASRYVTGQTMFINGGGLTP